MATDPWGFSVERQAMARRYRRARRLLGAARIAAFLGTVGGLFAGPTRLLRDAAGGTGGSPPIVVAGYAFLLYLLLWLVGLPFAAAGALIVDRGYGLSTMTGRGWLADEGKATALGLGFALVASEVLYALLRWSHAVWWLAAWGIGLPFQLGLGIVAPVLIAPMFFRFRKLQDGDLAGRLEALAQANGVPVVGAYEMVASAKSRRANAALVGFGRTRRIVVTDTLLRDFTPDEIETVLAHELAHHRHRDSWRGFTTAASTGLLGFAAVGLAFPPVASALGFPDIADVAALPLLLLVGGAVSLPLGPIENAFTRRSEARADAFAIAATTKREAFASAMVKLHDRNLALANPHRLVERLFSSHPSGRRRVQRALEVATSKAY